MPIDATAVARVLGIETAVEPPQAGQVFYLPQRIAVLAQGNTASSFATTKFQATSATHVGSEAGFGSPAHLIARQLMPTDGDGVGTIPVDIYLLENANGATAASGSITPSGTQTKAATYRALLNNILSAPFTVAASASVTDRCRALAEAINAALEMPATAAYTYGSVTSAAGTNGGNGTCTALSVTGSPTPGAYTLRCNTAVANGGVFTLLDPDGDVVSSSLTMTPGAGTATVLTAGGIQFTLTDASNDFEVDDEFTITVPATAVTLTSKWKGDSANAIYVEISGSSLGTTWTIVQPSGGATNPTLDAALAQFGNVWETLVINALDIDDETALDTIQTFGETRWGELVRKPFVAFTGNTVAPVTTALEPMEDRRDDRINCQLTSPGSKDLPFVVAARQVARIAKVANGNPPTDYGSQRATGLTPGADGDQWDYASRDIAVKGGSSTVSVRGGVVTIEDVVTFYRPEGDPLPAYRHVVDIIKLQNVIFNLDLEFAGPEWDGAPLIPDNQATTNPNARKPKSAKAASNTIVDALALAAILADPKATKDATTSGINSQNPKRLDLVVPVKLSGNTNIINAELRFGFYFGGSAA